MTQSTSLARVLLSTKLNPPTTTPSQVPRTSVWDLMRRASSVKVILIHAPAGFGKTTAMVQCRAHYEAAGVDSAWMTVDSADNDASRFLACLAAAVSKMTADHAVFAGDIKAPTFVSLGDIALDIMARLAAHTSPFVLFLDDFEALQEPTVVRLVREIIDNLPRRGQLVIGSRGVPDLGLGRLRARGQLLEIDAGQLRFSLDETTEFFTERRHIALPDVDLSQLQHKTEGWIAALWLASVALERRDGRSEFIARFSGSNQAVADYLAEDVLAAQPQHIRQFLLRTSILRHLNAPLCEALLPASGSAAILLQLEEANLFLTPVEGDEPSWRYHSLFSGFLRAQLARELPGELERLHCAASRWYEEQGRPVPAIDHALEGGNFEHVVRLLLLHAENLLEEGRMRMLSRWFAALPDQFLRSSQLLQIVHVWSVCFTRGPWESMALLDRSGCADTTDPQVLAHVLALRPMMLAMMDKTEEAYSMGNAALARLPSANAFADSALANEMAHLSAVMGQYQESRKLLDAARSRQGSSASTFNKMYSESVEGIIDLEEGQLRQAVARFRIAVSSTRSVSHRHTGGNAWAGVLYAGALYELNDLDQAEHLLHVYVPLAKNIGLADHMILGYVMMSRIAFHHGDIDQAFHCLTELEYLGHQRQLPRVVSSAKLERARVLLMQNNRHGAKDELDRANQPEVWQRVKRLRMPAHDVDYFELAELRWKIFLGDATDVVADVQQAIAEATSAKRHRRALKLRILLSLAFKQKGDLHSALSTMTAVLKDACPEGFLRLILDEGERTGALVRQVAQAQRADSSKGADPIFSVYIQKLLEGFGPASAAGAEIRLTQGNVALIEPLTAKEIRILSLLAEGYSNSALAEKLFVSDSTVRTHLRNINGKLNAQNRTQAVAVARQHGLIR
jgi:LuxR family maltose regulon positive regulatory protein